MYIPGKVKAEDPIKEMSVANEAGVCVWSCDTCTVIMCVREGYCRYLCICEHIQYSLSVHLHVHVQNCVSAP